MKRKSTRSLTSPSFYRSDLSRLNLASSPVTLRAVLLGCILLPINAYWIAMVEMVWHGFHFSATSIPMNVIFIVF
ncbi:uncharacterized protein METZ01_LOCUS345660, partial [marine metagenome]